MHKNRRILIVDDNQDIHADFKKILLPRRSTESRMAEIEAQLFGAAAGRTAPEFDYSIDSAFQGEQALKMVDEAARAGNPYALIFMDVRMPPGWDGIETIARIWASYPFVEVVLCTAYSDYSTEDIIESLGITHRLLILKKPFDSVAVKQMALAATTKWNLEFEMRNYTANLTRAVEERTAELSATVEKLQESQQKLIQASKMSALGEMAGGVAHEINTPLATLTLHVDILDRALKNGKVDLDMLKRSNDINRRITERIAKTVAGLRNFSRDGSRDPFVPKSMAELISETAALCEERMKNHGVTFILPEVGSDIMVDCRSVEISQVLLNLLNNAYDAVQARGEKWIKVGLELDGSDVLLSVTDSGPGISEEVQARLFQPFFTTKEVGKGTGLGLSISIGIVDAHKGALSYDRTCPNTKFVVRLPRLVSSSAA